MKRALIVLPAVAILLFFAGCGGGSNPNSGTTTSKITKRLLVTDTFQGQIYIVDANKDQYFGNTVPASSSPTLMAVFPDKLHTVVVDSGGTGLEVLDNKTEAFLFTFPLAAPTESIAVAPDNKTIYAAVRNESFAGQLPGAVEIADITSTTATTTTVQVPQVRRIVLSHNGAKLLAFSDNSDKVAVIDTAAKTVTYVAGFDRAVNGVFSSDDATAYILSCGAECGGTTAKVNALNISNNTVGADTVVSGATAGLLDSGNLYVAGSPNGVGKLDVISTSNMAVTKSGVAVANGYHSLMSLSAGQLYIGSTGCGNVASGCLSVFNVSAGSVVNSAAGTGDVTGFQSNDAKNEMYVIEGGEFVIWDSTKPAPLDQSKQIDIVGKATDTKLID